MRVYKVGGCVRDKLLGLPVSDNDYVVVGSSPEEMMSIGFVPVGKEFPVFLHPETKEEYALARTETKTGQGYKGFSFRFGPDISIEEDLKRRDLTINAIAEDNKGNLIDPYGGLEDLENKLLRHTSEAFKDDPLRVLRILRFAARFDDFVIELNTIFFIEGIIRRGEMKHLTPERIWIETEKALKTNNPHIYFEYMMNLGTSMEHVFGLIEIIFPELAKLIDKKEPEKHHPEKYTFKHTMLTLKTVSKLSKDPTIRFAALCHDLGKGETPISELPKHHGHQKAGIPIIENLCGRLKISNEYKELALLSCRYHMRVRQIWKLKPKTIVKTLMKLDAFRRPKRFKKFLIICEADYKGRLGKESDKCQETEFLNFCYLVCKYVNYNQVKNKKLEGKHIAEEIYRIRIKKVAIFKKGYKDEHNM